MISQSNSQVIRSVGWGNISLASLSIVFSIVFFEIALRVLPISYLERLRHHQEVGQGVREVHPKGLYTLHPEIGWTLTPRFSGEFKKDDFQIRVEANIDGIRDVDYGEKKDGTVRILGLGDSFAFGWGVENEESLFKVLEEKLNGKSVSFPGLTGESSLIDSRFRGNDIKSQIASPRRPRGTAGLSARPALEQAAPTLGTSARNDGPVVIARSADGATKQSRSNVIKYEVINAGIAGFGTYEASALTKAIGLKYAPNLAVLAFYEGNDYRNNGDAPREREIRDGYLADITKQKSMFLRFLTKHSILASFVESRVASIFQKMRFSGDFGKTKKYLLDLKTVLSQKGIPLVLMFIPDEDSAAHTRSDFKWKIDRFLGGMNLMDARLALEQFCRESGIKFFRLSKEFEDEELSASFRLKDTHFNAAGHQKAGHELFSFLTNDVLKKEFLQ